MLICAKWNVASTSRNTDASFKLHILVLCLNWSEVKNNIWKDSERSKSPLKMEIWEAYPWDSTAGSPSGRDRLGVENCRLRQGPQWLLSATLPGLSHARTRFPRTALFIEIYDSFLSGQLADLFWIVLEGIERAMGFIGRRFWCTLEKGAALKDSMWHRWSCWWLHFNFEFSSLFCFLSFRHVPVLHYRGWDPKHWGCVCISSTKIAFYKNLFQQEYFGMDANFWLSLANCINQNALSFLSKLHYEPANFHDWFIFDT